MLSELIVTFSDSDVNSADILLGTANPEGFLFPFCLFFLAFLVWVEKEKYAKTLLIEAGQVASRVI